MKCILTSKRHTNQWKSIYIYFLCTKWLSDHKKKKTYKNGLVARISSKWIWYMQIFVCNKYAGESNQTINEPSTSRQSFIISTRNEWISNNNLCYIRAECLWNYSFVRFKLLTETFSYCKYIPFLCIFFFKLKYDF